MSSKRVFSWQKRHSQVEPYYKTGGLVPIDTLGNESSTDHEAKLGASLTPAPTSSRHNPTENVFATASQDQTIATLRSKFSSLRLSHEARVSNLAERHAAEVASLRNYARLLEEQLAQHPSLHHTSSNNIPFFLDSSESFSTPSRESSQHTAGTSASSTLSSRSAPEKRKQSPRTSQDSSDMESLKRKLSTTRRPSTADRNLLPELNQYKQNNAALQTQISSLMAKLNESKKNEKALRATLQEVEQRCTEAERKTSEAQQLASSAEALQNTIDHLESRLEIANTEKLDAQEELFNMRALKSPFDASFPDFQMQDQNAHESVDTVFSADLRSDCCRDSGTSEYVAHIERLEDDIRQKDAYIADLEGDSSLLRQMLEQVNHQCDEINLQLDIQNELLGKSKETDAQIEQLRTAVLEREAVIGEKEKSVRAVERQLEHHRLLLQAEIRKHATTSRYLADEANPLPELTALATKKDIDRWIQKLNQRLRKAKPMTPVKAPMTETEALFEDLRNEIDFYVREIIYYKLDIRGYKSDIKKLNKITAQLSSYGNRASDLESDTSSLRPAPTPSRARFLATTPELKGSRQPSPAFTSNVTANMGSSRALTPPLSSAAGTTNNSPTQESQHGAYAYEEAASRVPILPQTPTKVTIVSAPHTIPTSEDIRQNTYSAPEAQEQLLTSRHDDHSEMLALAMGNPVPLLHPYRGPVTTTVDDQPEIEREDSGAATIRPVIPTSRFSQNLPSRSPSRDPSGTSHSRVGSASSILGSSLQPQSSTSRPERKLSASSSTGIPFVIAMGSPHNPAIAVAAKNKPVTRPQKNSSVTSRTGLDGTMASYTPLSSPTSIDGVYHVPTAASPVPTGHKRKLSLSFRKEENESPTTPTHTRSLSGGSIRTAIRWTKANNKGKENELQVRKDSVQPLTSLVQSEGGPGMMGRETGAIDFAPSHEDGKA
ncbi:hypothetical protein E8E11_004405 [Didymella keratinophila]|nr:hypothetical protein E8E11_004405 [Didymella keratinophila]